MLEHFHFIRPWWLLALLPLWPLAWAAFRPASGGNAWRRVVDARLLPLMMADGARAVSGSGFALAAAGWLVATLALADPTWELKPQPLFQTNASRVVVLDLSSSMYDADMKPSRLARARYKIEDVLAQSAEGQTALVAYAGDAFTVAPLTRDTRTISALLKALEPALMPVDGSRADLGLLKAGELLHQAGVSSGQVLLIADGVETGKDSAAQRAAASLRRQGYTVSVLGVGTPSGVPLTDAQGRLVHGAAGGVEVPGLNAGALASIASAGGGRYQPVTDAGSGLASLLDAGAAHTRTGAAQAPTVAPAWKERGPFVVLLLLPLAALAFRRNWLVSASLVAVLAVPAQGAMAATWSDLWQRPDQQASKALAAGDFAKAAAIAPDAARRGSADYKRGEYGLALDEFSRATGADADYNRGNALARLGRYQDAIAAYDKAIAEAPPNDDAKANKAAVEALLKQQPPPPPPPQQQQQQQQSPSAGSKQPSKQDSENQGDSRKPDQQGTPSKPDAAQQAKRSQGHAQADPAGSARGGASQAETGQPRPGDQAQPAPTRANEAEATNQAGNPQAMHPGADFAKAAQQIGKQGNEAAQQPTSPSTPAAADATRPAVAAASSEARPIEGEEKQAAEQWLRRIPDDPGGLLRRKFLYQYRHRANPSTADDE